MDILSRDCGVELLKASRYPLSLFLASFRNASISENVQHMLVLQSEQSPIRYSLTVALHVRKQIQIMNYLFFAYPAGRDPLGIHH